jgi:hypothetical protein
MELSEAPVSVERRREDVRGRWRYWRRRREDARGRWPYWRRRHVLQSGMMTMWGRRLMSHRLSGVRCCLGFLTDLDEKLSSKSVYYCHLRLDPDIIVIHSILPNPTHAATFTNSFQLLQVRGPIAIREDRHCPGVAMSFASQEYITCHSNSMICLTCTVSNTSLPLTPSHDLHSAYSETSLRTPLCKEHVPHPKPAVVTH